MNRFSRSLSAAVLGMAVLSVMLLLAGCKQTGIREAVIAGDTVAMERILKEHPDQANLVEPDGDPILHVAIQAGNEQAVRVLLDHGANVKAANAHGETPLDIAAYEGSASIMRTLLRKGAKLVSPNALLAKAAFAGNSEVAQLLISRGADVNGGAVPGSKDWSSPMHSAVRAEMPDMVDCLISNGGNVNVVDGSGRTPLHLAAESIYPQIAKMLMDHGANVNVKERNGETPLHHAASAGRTKMIGMLLDRGATVNAVAADGRTPYDIAAVERKGEAAAELRARGGTPSKRWELTDAVYLGDKAAIARILAERPAAATEQINGLTPLHAAARLGLIKSVDALVKGKVDINIRAFDDETPLHFAVRNARRDVVEYLVTHGANIHAKDKRGLTPIGYIYHSGLAFRNATPVSPSDERFRVIEQYLLAHGAKKE